MSAARADARHTARALQLARRGLCTTDPNPRVGCVLAQGDLIVGEGWHEVAGGPHAEVVALRQAGARAAGATACVTLEPCHHHGRTPPCTAALIDAGVARVVVAMTDPDPRTAGAGIEALRNAGIEVVTGVMTDEASALNPGFVSRHQRGRPYVRCKLGMTLDGRIATAGGESKWITSAEARADVQRLRARSSAIMTGIGTVLADDPALTLRHDELNLPAEQQAVVERIGLRQPLRVVVDSCGRLPATARVLTLAGRTLVAGLAATMPGDAGAVVEYLALPADGDGRVDLSALMAGLAQREVNELLLEAGPTLSGAMLAAGLIDELVIYIAPKLLGDNARGLFALPDLMRLDQAVGLEIIEVRAVGHDWRITATTG